ncbi:MAG: hypothetical protein ACTJH0_07180 [Psychrobacter sp.]
MKKILCTILCTILCASIFLVSCHTKPEIIDSEGLYTQFNKAHKNSAVSWWYLGDKGSYYYIAEKNPLKTNYYKINKENSPFKFGSKKLTFNKELWVNIKTEDFEEL